jgi:integrase
VWKWAIDNGLLPDGTANPFTNMTPRAPRDKRPARLPFNEDEAATILRAAREATGWERWLPWVLALTGARLGEVCDAAASDVRQVGGVWVLAVHPEAEGRSIKTQQSQRLVPLPDALIAEGFVRYASGLRAGSPLFPDLERSPT